ncbi:molybdopterin oxidoreductase family protein [Hydrogenophaga sp. 5NK40-0174]|uniref:molybdopterin-containing oxidoreductase family protein n=1 Tax=Hydrogenophaga sp. 5NK40-0174 TaxID=3127649 RepID=UPI0031081EDF
MPVSTAKHTPHTREVLGACPHDCPDTCALITTVDQQTGKAIRVQGNPDHPQTAGALCTKVAKYLDRTYHDERLLYPLRRTGAKGSGQFERVSWEEALEDIAARLGAIAKRDPQAILPYSYAGTMGLVQGESMASRFFNRLGASQLARTICSIAGGEGLIHSIGQKVGMLVEHFADSHLILIWGSNSITSNLHFWRYVQEAKRAGAKLVCIDPRRTETAEKCHVHLAIQPGTDAALAFGLMNEIVANGWADEDYIEKYTVGWAKLKERIRQWPADKAAQTCGIDADSIRALARDLGTTRDAGIRLNYGMQRVRGGGNAVRAIAALPAVTGAWRSHAGGLLMSNAGRFPIQRDALQRPELLAGATPRTINMVTIGDDLLKPASPLFGPAIEALVVYNSNPVAVAPESQKVVSGFSREDLFTVVIEQFQTDTADYADYVLPATTQLEHWDIHGSYGHTDVLLNRPAIAPLGEARSNASIFRDLAGRMGFTDSCFADSDEALCRQAFAEPVDFEQLERHGYQTLPMPSAPFAEGGFPTPSGKFEFFSQRLQDAGLDPLPDHVPNYEPAGADKRYPLAFISPPARRFLNSTFVNVRSLRDVEGEPLLEMHPQDAQSRSIGDGEWVLVYNDRGEYRCKVALNNRARPGVVNGLGIWWRKFASDGRNVNELTSQRLTDLGQGPVFYDCAVQVRSDP